MVDNNQAVHEAVLQYLEWYDRNKDAMPVEEVDAEITKKTTALAREVPRNTSYHTINECLAKHHHLPGIQEAGPVISDLYNRIEDNLIIYDAPVVLESLGDNLRTQKVLVLRSTVRNLGAGASGTIVNEGRAQHLGIYSQEGIIVNNQVIEEGAPHLGDYAENAILINNGTALGIGYKFVGLIAINTGKANEMTPFDECGIAINAGLVEVLSSETCAVNLQGGKYDSKVSVRVVDGDELPDKEKESVQKYLQPFVDIAKKFTDSPVREFSELSKQLRRLARQYKNSGIEDDLESTVSFRSISGVV